MNMIIRTVLGDIDPNDLGVTDMHDHLIRSGGEEVRKDKDFLMDSVEKGIEEFKSFLNSGGKSLVAMDPIGCGRNVPKMVKIAENFKNKANIVMCTGFHKGAFYDNRDYWLATCEVEEVAEMLALEITEGMDKYSYNGPIVKRTNYRAGVIKTGTGYSRITPFELKEIEVAAIAHIKTGAPIITHTQLGTMALEVIEEYSKYGVNPQNITLSHVQKNPDPLYHEQILSTGAYICFDGPDRVKYYTDEKIANLIYTNIKNGYGKQLVLSMDAGRASYQTAHTSGRTHGISYMLTKFIPILKEIGVSDKAIRDILINNPRRILSFNV